MPLWWKKKSGVKVEEIGKKGERAGDETH